MKSFNSILRSLFLTIALVAGNTFSFAVDAGTSVDAAIADADSAYSKANYEETIELYRGVIEQTGPSASLLFNLGNAYYKSGNDGGARLCLERAKRLDPSNALIAQNLHYITTRVDDANMAELKGKKGYVTSDETGFFGKLHRKISVDRTSDSWANMAAMAFILLILALALYFFSANVRFKKIGFFSAIIFFLFSVIFIVFAEMAAAHFDDKNEAVLMQFKITMKAEPADDANTVGFPLHRGTKFTILDSELNVDGEVGWYKVELNRNNIGWVPADALEII